MIVRENYGVKVFGEEDMLGFVVHCDSDAYGFVPVGVWRMYEG